MSNTTTVKLILGEEMRRLRVNGFSNCLKHFESLVKMAKDSFPSIANSAIKVFYLDDESDKIIIINDEDLYEAVLTMREDLEMKVLKFYIEGTSADTTSAPAPAAGPSVKTLPTSPTVENFVDGKFVPAKPSTTTNSTTGDASYPSTKNDEKTTSSSDTSSDDPLEALLAIFNLEMLAPFAHEWLNMLEASGDEKALFVVSLLKDPKFSDAIAEARTSEIGSKIFEALENELQNGMYPMFTMNTFIEDGSLKKLAEPIFEKFPDLLKHFPMLKYIIDPEADDTTTAGHGRSHGIFKMFGNLGGSPIPGMMPFMSMMGMGGGGCPIMGQGMGMGLPDMGMGMGPGMFPPHWKRRGRHCGGGNRRKYWHRNKGNEVPSESTSSTASPPTTSDSKNSVPDAATREILRNEQAIEAAISASLEEFADKDVISITNTEMSSNMGEEECKTNEMVESSTNSTTPPSTPVAPTAPATTEEDDFVALPSMEDKFSKELDILKSMGFNDIKHNIELLQEKDGNLRAVVEYYLM